MAKTVLVVEDNEDIREAVVDVIRCGGYGVLEAENGQRALEILATMKDEPCLVLLDMMMPVMDGWQFLQALDEAHVLATLPVVVVSAGLDSSVRGARRVIKKPVSPEVLEDVVRDFCGAVT